MSWQISKPVDFRTVKAEKRVLQLEDRLREIGKVMEWDAMKRPAPALTQEARKLIRGLCGGIS